MRTEVYSWRLDSDRKAALAEQARRRGTTIAQLLEEATDGLLSAHDSEADEGQSRLHSEAQKLFGTIQGDGRSADAASVRESFRRRTAEKRRAGRP